MEEGRRRRLRSTRRNCGEPFQGRGVTIRACTKCSAACAMCYVLCVCGVVCRCSARGHTVDSVFVDGKVFLLEAVPWHRAASVLAAMQRREGGALGNVE